MCLAVFFLTVGEYTQVGIKAFREHPDRNYKSSSAKHRDEGSVLNSRLFNLIFSFLDRRSVWFICCGHSGPDPDA